jgi:FAD-dependent urate hydroxylase
VSVDAEVAVIGAGPYGLSCTRFLKKAGVDVLTFGERMRFWQERMPEKMILRSRRRSSHIADPDGSLSLDAFAAEHGHPRLDPVPLAEFERYGAWYGERAAPDLDGRRIIAVVPRGERSFTLRLEDGTEPTVSRVIVAAGISPFAWRDSPLAELSDELVSHSSYHRDFGRFRGRSVVIVGSGQSALESAALLHEEGAAVELIGRRPAPIWLAGHGDSLRARVRAGMAPPTDVGGRVTGWLAAAPGVMHGSPRALREWTTARCVVPAGADWLPERVRDVTMTMDRQVSSAEARNGTVWISLDDGSEREVDHAILATGWRIDAARYPFLDRSIVERLDLRNGYPVLGPGLESSIPGLHFVGTAAAMSFGPINRFVVGSWYAAPVVARAATGKRQRPLRFSYRPRRGRLTVN